MTVNINYTFWREFFELYRSFPETWKIKSEIYKNKNAKAKAYVVLLKKYQEIDKNATVETVKKKINAIRTCYRRELKKISNSERSGAGEEDVYLPSLWYFNELEFLRDQEEQLQGVSSIDLEENTPENSIIEDDVANAHNFKKIKRDTNKQRSDLLKKAVQHLEESVKKPDEASALSATWEVLFRKLEPLQQLFANKTIIEVLYQGALGKLTENTCRTLERSNIYAVSGSQSSTSLSTRIQSPLVFNESILSTQSQPEENEFYVEEGSHNSIYDLIADTEYS